MSTPTGTAPAWREPAGSGHGSLLAGARAVASDATTELSVAALEAMMLRLPLPRDPVDELVDGVRPVLRGAVDALQVAAVLEAEGVTDRVARVQYGYADVFDLAYDV